MFRDCLVIEKLPIAKLPGVARLQAMAAKYYEQQLLEEVMRRGNIPRHVAIILDGNRRFAQKAGLDKLRGHDLGAKKLDEVLGWCQELGIKQSRFTPFQPRTSTAPARS